MRNIFGKIYWFLKDIILGVVRYRYPLCCIQEYAVRMWKSRYNQESLYVCKMFEEVEKKLDWFEERQIDLGYVPCSKCFEKIKKDWEKEWIFRKDKCDWILIRNRNTKIKKVFKFE